MGEGEKVAKDYIKQMECYRLFSSDMNDAFHGLKMLRKYKRGDIRYCLIQMVVVSYARPFSSNKVLGEQKKGRYDLKKEIHVPQALWSFHEEVIEMRNQVFAHTDHSFRKPKIANWSNDEQGMFFPMVARGFYYDTVNKKVPEISTLIEAVNNNLNAEITRLQERACKEGYKGPNALPLT